MSVGAGKLLKISIVTVSYNSETTIKDTVLSVCDQTHRLVEFLVIDGASSDRTTQVVSEVATRPVYMVSEADRGIYDAMNKGVESASGDIIGILNSDDYFLSDDVLEKVSRIFEADPALEAVLGGVDFVRPDRTSAPIRRFHAVWFTPVLLRLGLMPPHPAVFVRRSVYERVGKFKLCYKIAADFDFLVRVLLLGRARYCVIDETFVRMRVGGASTSGFQSAKIITEEMHRSLQENGYWSSRILLWMRLPIKFITQVLLR